MDNELKEALEIVLGFDITKFEDVRKNSRMGCLFNYIEEPRRLKWAFNCLSKQFGWGKLFVLKNMAIVDLQSVLKLMTSNFLML